MARRTPKRRLYAYVLCSILSILSIASTHSVLRIWCIFVADGFVSVWSYYVVPVSDRIILVPPSQSHMQMISCSCTNHSSTLVLISSKSNYVLVPQMGSTSIQTSPRIKLLMQNPRKWTPKHVDAAKTKVIENARAEDLFGLDLIPSDGDPGMIHAFFIWLP